MQRLRNRSIRLWFAGALGLATALAFPPPAHAGTVWTATVYVSKVVAYTDGSIYVYLEDDTGSIYYPCAGAFSGNNWPYASQAAAAGTPGSLSILNAAALARKKVSLYVTANNTTSCTFARTQLYAE